MSLIFSGDVNAIDLDAARINGLDFNNDGSLLAVAFSSASKQPGVLVYQTTNHEIVGQFCELGAALDVMYLSDRNELWYLTRAQDGSIELRIANLGGIQEISLATYGSGEAIHALRRSRDNRNIAVLGNAVEVWDTARREVIRFKEADNPLAYIQASFNFDGSHLFIYGMRPSQVYCFDLLNDKFREEYPAPTPYGQQVVISPFDEYLVLVGQGETGVYIYDLEKQTRLFADEYNENSFTQPFLFSMDGSIMITLERNLIGQPLPGGDLIYGPKLITGMPSAVASANDNPMLAYGIKNTLFWISLIQG